MISFEQLSLVNLIGSAALISYVAYDQRSNIEPLPQQTQSAVQTSGSMSMRTGVPTIKEVFSDFEAPLLEAALHRDESPSHVLPSPDLVKSAIASESIHSPQSKEVLSIYEKAYEHYELPYPALNTSDEGSDGDGDGETYASTAEEQVIRAYFQGQLLRIARAANKQDIPVQDSIPTPKEIEDAIRSGSISSPASQLAIEKIQATYKKLSIPFHPPTAE